VHADEEDHARPGWTSTGHLAVEESVRMTDSTQNRSFWRRFPEPISWLGMEKQEAQLSPSDRAMRLVSSNLAKCHATVQKLLVSAEWSSIPESNKD